MGIGLLVAAIAFALACVLWCIVVTIRAERSDYQRDRYEYAANYDETHPPISDEEFMRKCSPGIRPEVALPVRRIVSDVHGIDYERIYPDTNLAKLDSL